ncbi:MAG: 3-deoxy-D-manno-octulosonic-acid kinase [Candidatus Accumulibacter appositus]|uniref:3-deoxy-D-manno-octulosonic-acid kinase n=1 Tax=Candidatus Accumulibacter appositus TaxID=1454003 RepID=A0A011QVN8_9PROT|nr:lipopolysaccharide kinase InaA family protein [Accumulibacter sp.]EXI82934.1 MAG: 3-deoxy-D-manno-octulosonic-acid kinase [Candidatus Accumulibacter appositus]HRF04559.1 lipopolysaccharide kinase InaA family protein [Accumulibacter sp.]
MSAPALSDARTLRAAGRQPSLPFCVALADGRQLSMRRLLRVLPGKRLVGEAELDGRRVLAKLFVGRRCEKHWRHERGGLEALREAGVPTPELLVAMAMAGGGYALLTVFLEAAESLGQAWARLSGRAVGDGEALAVLAPALAMLGRLHAAGLVQDDLHLGNFLRHDGRLLVVDGDAVRVISRGQPLSPADAGANLAVLLAQLPPAWDGQLPALLPAYTAEQAFLPERAVMQRNIERVRAWRLGDFLAKTVRECTLFAVEQTATRFSAVRRDEAAVLASLLAAPDSAIGRGQVFKDGGTTTVARLAATGRTLLIKRYNLKSLRHALGRLWRPSRAWHSWREAHRLLFFGIPTPRPLALIEERCGPLRRRAWLISEYCPGPNLLSHLSADCIPPAKEAKAMRELFGALCRHQISHGDLKATNLLWDGELVQLIDLDGVVQHRSASAHARAWRRDRARLLRNWPAGCVLRGWLDEQLPPA